MSWEKNYTSSCGAMMMMMTMTMMWRFEMEVEAENLSHNKTRLGAPTKSGAKTMFRPHPRKWPTTNPSAWQLAPKSHYFTSPLDS